jgi:hypothetical protein
MKIIIVSIISCMLLLMTGCGTALRIHKDGDLKNAVNIATTPLNKDIKVFQNNKELSSKIVYDGADKSSPFMVRRYFLNSAPDELDLEIEKDGTRQKVSITKIKKKPNFWIQGLWFFIDYATGAMKYYDDVAIDE